MKLGKKRSSIESSAAAIVVIFLLIFLAFGYLGYQIITKPRASVSISFASGCQVSYIVTNDDTRIFHGWSVVLAVSPPGSGVVITPPASPVQALAPGGNATGKFAMNYSAAPRGNYGIIANLINGTQTIAQSSSVTCTVG